MRKSFKKSNLGTKIVVAILLFYLSASIFSWLFMGDSYRLPSGPSLAPPSPGHWLGTDDLGIDIWAQICRGTQISIFTGCATALLAGFGGCILGILAGYRPGLIDRTITLLGDVSLCVPHFPLVIVISAFFGSGLLNIILVLSLLSWAEPARTIRASVLSMRTQGYLLMAKSYGGTFSWMLKKHFIPHLMPVFNVYLLKIGSHAIVHQAGLSLLGLGDPSSKSWGSIMNRAINFPGIYYTNYWKWWLLPPLGAIILFVVTISLLGRKLERVDI